MSETEEACGGSRAVSRIVRSQRTGGGFWSVGEVLEGLGSRGASLFPDSGWCALGWGRGSAGGQMKEGELQLPERRSCGERAGS